VGATEEIIKLAKENNGIVTTAMMVAAGISRGNSKYLVDKGMIEKSTRGVYTLPEVWDDEKIQFAEYSPCRQTRKQACSLSRHSPYCPASKYALTCASTRRAIFKHCPAWLKASRIYFSQNR